MSLSNVLNVINEQQISKPAKGADNVLKKELQSRRLKQSRLQKPWVQGKKFSPSMITYSYCRRAKIGQMAGKLKLYYDVAAPSQQTIFDLGNIYHDLLQLYFWNTRMLKGTYECYRCPDDANTFDNLIAPKKCPNGHSRKYMAYKEVQMEKGLIKGRCDGILVLPDGEELVDIKSISNRSGDSGPMELCFEDLDTQGPKHFHLVQIMLYMWMSDIHKGHLYYISKNKGKQKSFTVDYDYSLIKPYLDEVTRLERLANKLQGGLLMPEDLPTPCGKKDCKCDEILARA